MSDPGGSARERVELQGMSTGPEQPSEVDARLLWAAANPFPDLDAIRDAVDAGADVELTAGAAIRNRVGPLYWRNLDAAGCRDLLGDATPFLHRDAHRQRVREELLLPQALQLTLTPLAERGIEPLVFKGPALVDRYPARGLRPMDDIDVIVPERQHQEAVAALTASGWHSIDNRLGRHYDTYLLHPDVPGLSLELHWDLSVWRDRTTAMRGTSLWEHRAPATLAGVPAFALRPELELPALANHAGKPFHHFRRLMWAVDIAVVVHAAGADLDWELVASLARRFRCQTVLAVALCLASRFGVDAPDELVRLPAAGLRRNALEPLLDATWPMTEPDDGDVHRLRYAMCDSQLRRMELLVGEVTDDGTAGGAVTNALRLSRLAARRWWIDKRLHRSGGRTLTA